MRIKFIKNKSFEQHNRIYNHNITASVERVFTTQTTGSIGYQRSTAINTENNRHDYFDEYVDSNNKQKESSGIPHISMAGLGPCERNLLDKICNPAFPFVIVTGGLGSGKSTLVNFMAEHIKKTIRCHLCRENSNCLHQNCTIEVIDLMQMVVDITNDEKVFSKFLKTLSISLEARITEIMTNTKVMDSFCTRLKNKSKKNNNSKWQDNFLEFESEMLEDISNWNENSDVKKSKKLLNWIKNKESDINERVDLFTQLLAAVREDFPEKLQGCLIMIYDNIDSYTANIQQKIITYLSTLTEITGIITILTARLTTYGKIIDTGGHRSFTLYQHAGPIPTEIISSRLAHYINIESYLESNTIPKEHKTYFDNKAKVIYNILTDRENNSRLLKAIDALAGNSIRRGLALAERMFINDVSPYDDNSVLSQDGILRSILLGENEDFLLNVEDRYLSNIFLNYIDRANSLICIRTLQILANRKQNNKKVSLYELVEGIRSFCPYEKESIIHTLKYLTQDNKRLIFFLGKSTWESAFDDKESHDFEVEITLSGALYLKTLTVELSYIQSAFQSLEWTNAERDIVLNSMTPDIKKYINRKIDASKSNKLIKDSVKQSLLNGDTIDNLPFMIDNNSTIERLSALRSMLRIFLINDFLQTINHTYNSIISQKQNRIIDEVFFVKVIGTIAISVFNILKTDLATKEEEFTHWFDLCLTSNNISEVLFPSINCSELEHAIRLYSTELNK